jgi:hypothetical protein
MNKQDDKLFEEVISRVETANRDSLLTLYVKTSEAMSKTYDLIGKNAELVTTNPKAYKLALDSIKGYNRVLSALTARLEELNLADNQ